MSADDDPQPSTSSGVTRSETTVPLNEQEYKYLAQSLGPNFGDVGDRLVRSCYAIREKPLNELAFAFCLGLNVSKHVRSISCMREVHASRSLQVQVSSTSFMQVIAMRKQFGKVRKTPV